MNTLDKNLDGLVDKVREANRFEKDGESFHNLDLKWIEDQDLKTVLGAYKYGGMPIDDVGKYIRFKVEEMIKNV